MTCPLITDEPAVLTWAIALARRGVLPDEPPKRHWWRELVVTRHAISCRVSAFIGRDPRPCSECGEPIPGRRIVRHYQDAHAPTKTHQ